MGYFFLPRNVLQKLKGLSKSTQKNVSLLTSLIGGGGGVGGHFPPKLLLLGTEQKIQIYK